ncbi:hypothetical protein VZT92_013779 [Zoarces viviparus]|uniref:Uncharacterized protein n=1 Tax=Zoarces viviparus TaxID=48416 RepID=A0AAW1F582_ZOAVI
MSQPAPGRSDAGTASRGDASAYKKRSALRHGPERLEELDNMLEGNVSGSSGSSLAAMFSPPVASMEMRS